MPQVSVLITVTLQTCTALSLGTAANASGFLQIAFGKCLGETHLRTYPAARADAFAIGAEDFSPTKETAGQPAPLSLHGTSRCGTASRSRGIEFPLGALQRAYLLARVGPSEDKHQCLCFKRLNQNTLVNEAVWKSCRAKVTPPSFSRTFLLEL